MTDEDIESQKQKLIAAYRGGLTGKAGKLQQALSAIAAGDVSAEMLQECRMSLHKMAGSASSFGFPLVTRLAAEVETILVNDPQLSESREHFLQRAEELIKLLHQRANESD